MKYRDLWERYWQTRSVEDRNVLVERYTCIAWSVAGKMKIPASVDIGDLFQAAMPALIKCVEDYKDGLGKFSTRCYMRILGAMLDELRSCHLFGFNAYRYYDRHGIDGPAIVGLEHKTRASIDSCRDQYNAKSIGEMLQSQIAEHPDPDDMWPIVREVLVDSQYAVVHGRYVEGREFKDMGVSYDAANQQCCYAIRKLRTSGRLESLRPAA